MSKAVASMVGTPAWVGSTLCIFLFLGAAPQLLAAQQAEHTAHATRHDLVGTWALVSIQIIAPQGAASNDPFYNADPSGILMYQASGWMSVQIAGQPRPAMEAEGSRPPRTESSDVAQRKAAVLDTYYAYFGTWDYDAATSIVTHHIKSSLIPGESGRSYSQQVALEGGNLIFSSKHEAAGVVTLQKKVWKRITGPKD